MNETPTPEKPLGRRRGLTLPPRGQALSRLQDLESEEVSPAPPQTPAAADVTEVRNAVNTASSNAATQEGSAPGPIEAAAGPQGEASPATLRPAAPTYRPAARAAREPTTRITVDMPDSLHRQISMLSAETRRSIKDLVIEALEATYFGTPEAGR